MIPASFTPPRPLLHVICSAALYCSALLQSDTARATPIPANLGNGLDKLVNNRLVLAQARAEGIKLDNLVEAADGQTYLNAPTAAVASHSLHDATGRVLVRITLDGRATYEDTRKAMQAAAGSLSITAEDTKYRGVGIMNAYVAVADAPALARVPGVAAVILEWRPHVRHARLEETSSTGEPQATSGEQIHVLGTDFDQGVTQHRVDQINKYYNASATSDFEGAGMQIACISNSFNAHTANPASIDVNNFDLPGSSSNPVNKTPVYVFLDDKSDSESDDEGRGMCQIAYKMAPKAAIGFGTADTGEVGFANVIRGLAGLSGYTKSGQTFAADTICDDVGYDDEPMFQDGIIADGIDDASAAGVCYFSAAGNDIGTSGYDSPLRWIANDPTGSGALTAAGGNTALANSNIDLTDVPKGLYAGGFHNFDASGTAAAGTTDIAQTVNDDSTYGVETVLQWNEPYDQTAEPAGKKLIWTQKGNYTSSSDNAYTFTITPSLTTGTLYELDEVANGDGFDGAITIKAPNGDVIVPRQDNDVDETVRFKATVTGTGYKVIVGHYSTTTGNYTLNLYSTTGFGADSVQTQINLLVFDMSGKYLPDQALTTDGRITDEPLQIGVTSSTSSSQVQFVIARSNVPAASPVVATRVRYLLPGDGLPGLGPAQYFTYTTPTTYGHAMAGTCNGCAAYGVFRPSLPETYSSLGPATIYFDKSNKPLSTPEVRHQPAIAAADGANVSSNMNDYFADDDSADPDTSGNFYGTSAAGPHAAAIAALVLEAKGGRHSVTPAQMTTLLESSTYPHDLDPNHARGAASVSTGGEVAVAINSDDSDNESVGKNDNHAFAVTYTGKSSVTSLVFNPAGTASTAGNRSGGNNGVKYASGKGRTGTYFTHSLPGVAFFPDDKAFTLGGGVAGATAAFSNPSTGAAPEYYTMTVTIPSGKLKSGETLHFTVGRGVARSADTGNGGTTVTNATVGSVYYCADIFGGGVVLPDDTLETRGMAFSGKTADGGTFSGTFSNKLGAGYSPLDGFGFIDAQAAVAQTVK